MPAISSSTDVHILVTCANGYIAMWIIEKLLSRGYCVRGTVRTAEKGGSLKEKFSKYANRLEYVVVNDITLPGAFDEAVRNVEGIVHTASPLGSSNEDPDAYIIPAVEGTTGLLKSALTTGKSVKRIVLTSSCLAVISSIDPTLKVFDEGDWGDSSVDIVKKEGAAAPTMFKYRASKTLAEKAAWSFVETHKDEIGWDLVAINPPMVVGPTLANVKAVSDLNASLTAWFQTIQKTGVKQERFGVQGYTYVDVRDVAEAHILALTKEEAKDQRVIVSAGSISWQESRDILFEQRPDLFQKGLLKRDEDPISHGRLMAFNNLKSKEVLGITYRSAEETFVDTISDLEFRGLFS